MPSILEARANQRFYSSTATLYQGDLDLRRVERLDLIWRIANRLWDDYLIKPSGCEEAIWDGVTKRFTVTDLQTPVVRTILSASHSGKISRRVKSCMNPEEVQAVLDSPEYDSFIKERFVPESIQYGTTYAALGFRHGKFHLTSLPPVSTQIITSDYDVEDIQAIVADYGSSVRSYEANGIYVATATNADYTLQPNTNCGFIPVAIGRGFLADCQSPYGVDMIWPATQETVQCTFLMNDAMVLERLQSFSTLVVKGAEAASPKQRGGASPFATIRLAAGDDSDAYYITPQAAIDQIDKLIASKFERCAVQCGVPVEIFTKSKSGVNQSAGSSYLTHKPLYDLVITVQEQKRREEMDLVARIDAMFTWYKGGMVTPANLELHREKLEMDVVYERETNPSINQSDAQAYESLVSSKFIKHGKAYWHFNPEGDDAEQKELESEREKDMQVAIKAPGIKGKSSVEEQ